MSDKLLRSKRRHFCPLCPKHYDYKKQLEDHVRSFHEKERNAECHICNKSELDVLLKNFLGFVRYAAICNLC